MWFLLLSLRKLPWLRSANTDLDGQGHCAAGNSEVEAKANIIVTAEKQVIIITIICDTTCIPLQTKGRGLILLDGD